MLKPMNLRRPFLLLCILTGLSAFGLSAADVQRGVLAVLEMQQEAWNRGDLNGFLEGYEKSPDISFVGKTVARGFEGLERRYRLTYGNAGKMGKLTFSEIDVKPLGEEYAFAIGRFELQRSVAGGGNAAGRFTIVLRKTARGWRIIHDHTSAE
ncbi:MAG: nuclear transport factor 2 family protein [Bryobacterales bacterium]|nr:nuclear transport factor 2 family protein [Bryobacterales bacterium]